MYADGIRASIIEQVSTRLNTYIVKRIILTY